MRDELNCWDFLQHREFTGREAALAIVGEPETDSPETLAKTLPVLDLMRQSYEGTRRWFANAPEDGETPPRGLLMSLSMQESQGRTTPDLVAAGAGDVRFLTWLRTPMADFDRQEFTRDVLARWVDEVGATSLYPFVRRQKVTADEVVPASNNPNPEYQSEILAQAEVVEGLGFKPSNESPADIAEDTSNATVVKHRAKRQTWFDVSSQYIVGVMRAGQYGSCKELFRALAAKAGPDSPFDKGTGDNRGKLFVRQISCSLALHTLENRMKDLRALEELTR